MSEAGIQKQIMLALSLAGHTVFRANVGQAWQGTIISRSPGLLVLGDPRPFNTGLPVGFTDLFGFTPDLHPFFLEVKTPKGRLRSEQAAFQAAMRARGASAGVVRYVEQAVNGVWSHV